MKGGEQAMQYMSALSAAETYLQVQLTALVGQITAWSDSIYASGNAPAAHACMAVAGVAGLALIWFAYFNEKDAETWSALALAGRWMASVAAFAVVIVIWVGSRGAA
jgi:hypothetical protein